jgi:hypothetical protein
MVFKMNAAEFDQQEALKYRPGQRVELKQRPGIVDIIAEYDPMMVPPISLVNDPKPRYPEELILLVKPVMGAEWLKPAARRNIRVAAPSCVLAR